MAMASTTKVKDGRPAAAPPTRRRPALERVLTTADRLFYAEGIHATGVDRIAAEAGVSKTSLYTYFATKEDLVAEYPGGRSRAWRTHLESELGSRGGDPAERIGVVFDVLGEWFASDGFRGCPFINAEAEGDSEPSHVVTLEHRAWIRGLFADLLTQAGVADPDATSVQLAMLYDGAMTSAHAESGVRWAQQARAAACTLVRAAQPAA